MHRPDPNIALSKLFEGQVSKSTIKIQKQKQQKVQSCYKKYSQKIDKYTNCMLEASSQQTAQESRLNFGMIYAQSEFLDCVAHEPEHACVRSLKKTLARLDRRMDKFLKHNK